MPQIAPDQFTVAQATAALGVTAPAVRRAIQRGLIVPVRLDGRTNLIPRSAVEAYRARHQGRRGRPPKSRSQPAGPAEERTR